MQLCDKSIYKALKNGSLVIIGLNEKYPFIPAKQVQPASVDLRLGNRFVKFSDKISEFDIRNIESIEQYSIVEQIEDGQGVIIKPNEIIYGQIYEQISIGDEFSAKIEGRSRVARLGISVHCTGDYINPGFIGAMPLQIINHNSFSIVLYPYIGICQMVIYKLTDIPLIKYSEKVRLQDDRYYGEDVPSASIISADPLNGIKMGNSLIEKKIDMLIEQYNKSIEREMNSISETTISRQSADKLSGNYIYNINIEGEVMRDQYNAKQAGIQGSKAGEQAVIHQYYTESKIDESEYQELIDEISNLRNYIKECHNYSSDEIDIMVGELVQIKNAVQKKDENKFLGLLKQSGKQFYDIAKSLGCAVLSKYISSQLGF